MEYFERYQRHSLINWFSQAKISSAHIAVIGAGAIGNELLKNLALLGAGHIDIFDFDTIEIHNLTRSVLFREDDVGQPKAQVAAARIQSLDPQIAVRAFVGDVREQLTLEMLPQYQVVIACLDNMEARFVVNRCCYLRKVDFIDTAIDSRFASVEYFPFSSGQIAACLECNLPPSVYRQVARRYSCGWLRRVASQEKKIPTTIVTAAIAAAYATALALRFGEGGQARESFQLSFDSISGAAMRTRKRKVAGCPVCSLPPPHQVLRVANRLESRFNPFDWPGEEVQLLLSDPIVIGYRCSHCDPPGKDGLHTVFERADRFDETLAHCPHCQEASRQVVIRDSFTLAELMADFPGRKLPCRYLLLRSGKQTFLFDLKEAPAAAPPGKHELPLSAAANATGVPDHER